MIFNELFVAGKAMEINMKKLFLLLLVASVCLSMLTACSQSTPDTATDSTNENEVTVSVTEQKSNPDLNTASSSTAPVRHDKTTAKTNASKADKADNDVAFSNNETTTSAKKTETTSSAVEPSSNLNETTVVNNTKTDKNKITTDKDGWVDKWY